MSILKAFLASARNALKARSGPLTFVVGNESADLDSLCSAIVYAFIRTQAAPQHAPPHIPLSNLPRADLALRPEMTFVLDQAGLTPADVLTLSELDDGLALQPHDTRWILVDHNVLTGPLLTRFSSAPVVACLDHHADEGVVPGDAEPRIIEPCGSCMSLIVAESRSVWQEQQQQQQHHDPLLTKLSLAPILVDTTNLTNEAKVRPKDRDAANLLLSRLSSSFSPDKYYDDIVAIKEDLSGLSLRDILRKDYKQWDDVVGVSCVAQGFDFLLDDKAGGQTALFLHEISAWAAERELDIVALMTTSRPAGNFRRELLVWGLNPSGRDIVAKFVPLAVDKLRLEPWRDGLLDDEADTRFAWTQLDLASSRKQVAPLLREALNLSRDAAKS